VATVDDTYGIDYSTYPADLTFRPIGGTDALAQEAVRRITTRAGALWWDPTGTLDVHEWINDTLSVADLRSREKRIEALFDPDPRMDVVAALRYEARELFVSLEITPTDGAPFTVTVNAATGALTVSGAA